MRSQRSTCCPHSAPGTNVRPRVIAGVLGLLCLVNTALARPQPVDAAPPAPADTVAAFRVVQTWVRGWTVSAESPADLPAFRGVCIILRQQNRTIARSEAFSYDGVPHPDLLAHCARNALQQAATRLQVPNDALREDTLRALAPSIAISLELAGPLTPIAPATWAEVDQTLGPGLDGVAASVLDYWMDGDVMQSGRRSPAAFPSFMLMTGAPPSRALAGVCAETIGPGGAADVLDDPVKIREKHRIRMSRFRVTHVAQSAPDAEPVILFRGSRLIPVSHTPLPAELSAAAHAIAVHLRARAVKTTSPLPRFLHDLLPAASRDRATFDSLRLRDFGPASDDPSPRFAADLDTALVAFALRRFSRWANDPAADELALDLLAGIFARSIDTPCAELDPALRAAWAAAIHSFNDVYRSPMLGDRLAAWQRVDTTNQLARLAAAFQTRACDPDPATPDLCESLSPALRAMAGLFRAENPLPPINPSAPPRTVEVAAAQAVAEDIERCVLPALASPDLVAAMPWAGWGAQAVASARAAERAAKTRMANHRPGVAEAPNLRPAPEAADDVPGAIALRQMRSEVWAHQLSLAEAGADRQDMVGGIVFTRGVKEGQAPPYPTWHTARPLAFIASMLRDPRLTEPAERPRELARLLAACRYLLQLQVDDAACWMEPNPAAARGAIRAALWDRATPLDASAFALLCFIETLDSIEELSAPTQHHDTSTP